MKFHLAKTITPGLLLTNDPPEALQPLYGALCELGFTPATPAAHDLKRPVVIICGLTQFRPESYHPQHELTRMAQKQLYELGVPDDLIIPATALCLSSFTVQRYRLIRQTPPTIIADMCASRFTYLTLGLRFTSPFLNLTIEETQYLKLLRNLPMYLSQPLEDYGSVPHPVVTGANFPQGRLGDIVLNFTHYRSFSAAQKSFDQRRQRVNLNYLVLFFHTASRKLADEFLALPCPRKICFLEDIVSAVKFKSLHKDHPTALTVSNVGLKQLKFANDFKSSLGLAHSLNS
ncbi:MAG: DUF1919 domain-containing protein, partial [Succinivibrio sp.]|nr:DUF1919 domain-containing protein [Succinivibrio sp.]